MRTRRKNEKCYFIFVIIFTTEIAQLQRWSMQFHMRHGIFHCNYMKYMTICFIVSVEYAKSHMKRLTGLHNLLIIRVSWNWSMKPCMWSKLPSISCADTMLSTVILLFKVHEHSVKSWSPSCELNYTAKLLFHQSPTRHSHWQLSHRSASVVNSPYSHCPVTV